MIVLFSSLKKYLPDLNATPKEVCEVFTLTGFMLDKFKEVTYLGNTDYLIDLEVRQNRADSLGVIGLARELSSYFNIPLNLPGPFNVNYPTALNSLPIKIRANNDVKRVKAIKLSNIKISESEPWLKEYLAFYDIKSINNLVDLTNYVMIETGIPSHAFDLDLTKTEGLVWEINNDSKEFTTLSGEVVKLSGGELVISDGSTPLSLSMVGSKHVAINSNTHEIILEMGVYNNGLIRRNSRDLKIITEASTRLEKYLDTESIDSSFEMLVSLLMQYCNAEITSNVFDEYIVKPTIKEILVDLDKLQRVAGIEIAYHESIDYLTRLGFSILDTQLPKLLVRAPSFRTDISIEEDVFEEVIRLKGFNKLDLSQLNVNIVKDITPLHLKVIEEIENTLTKDGFDESRSWVLVDEENIKLTSSDYLIDYAKVTNSINEEVPFLRKSLSFNLIKQADNYIKHNILDIRIFEIGKVFHKKLIDTNLDDPLAKYFENYNLSLLLNSKDINSLKLSLEKVFRNLGISNIKYVISSNSIKLASANNFYDIYGNNTLVGNLYIVNPKVRKNIVICEVNIDVLSTLVDNTSKSSIELENRIIELDTNIKLTEKEDINTYINNILDTKLKTKVFKYTILDKFKEDHTIKYTLRISYLNLSDIEAKELHSSTFENI